MSGVVKNHRNRLHFELINQNDLIEKINWAFNNFESMRNYGQSAFCDYQNNYSIQISYEKQLKIYQAAINEKSGERG